VRGFNPGGNHGSFFRISTHSLLMLAGGDATRIPRALVIREPYDSLSFVPTILALTNQAAPPSNMMPARFEKLERLYPGRIINELFDPAWTHPARPVADTAGGSVGRSKAEASP
jgi:hypothetical protein